MVIVSTKYCLVTYDKAGVKYYIECKNKSNDNCIVYKLTDKFTDCCLLFDTYNGVFKWFKDFIKSNEYKSLVETYSDNFDFDEIDVLIRYVSETTMCSMSKDDN